MPESADFRPSLAVADLGSPPSQLTPLSFSEERDPYYLVTMQLINEFLTDGEASVSGEEQSAVAVEKIRKVEEAPTPQTFIGKSLSFKDLEMATRE